MVFAASVSLTGVPSRDSLGNLTVHDAVELCYAVDAGPPICNNLLFGGGLPALQGLAPNCAHALSTWLSYGGSASVFTNITFELASVINEASIASLSSSPLSRYAGGVPYDEHFVRRVGDCLRGSPRNSTALSPSKPSASRPSVERVYRSGDAFLGAAVHGILGARDLEQLDALVACAEATPLWERGPRYDGSVSRDDFGTTATKQHYYGSHKLSNLNPLLGRLLPEVKRSIYSAVHAAALAGGAAPVLLPAAAEEPLVASSLGFRCVEHITYPPGVGLDEHEDEDSTFTVSVLLSDHGEFGGGDFVLLGDTRVAAESFAKPGDGLVFDSVRAHRVTPVTSGVSSTKNACNSPIMAISALYD